MIFILLCTVAISTKSTDPVLTKKPKTDDVGFDGLDQDQCPECFPGSVLALSQYK